MKDLDPWKLLLGGTALIEASAGTGKTYTLTTLYLRLLVERDLSPREILVVTYTQAAMAELRERIRERIHEALSAAAAAGAGMDTDEAGEGPSEDELALQALALEARTRGELPGGRDPLRRALAEFDEAAIFTIHGFCQRTLQENAFESGVAFDAELVEASDPLQETLARDLFARLVGEQEPRFVEWLWQGPGRSRWGFEPEQLKRSVLDVLGADEEMPILPASVETQESDFDLDALDGKLFEALALWATSWRAGRADCVEWLLEGGALNGNKYRRATLEGTWLPALDAWSGIEGTSAAAWREFELPDWWTKLTPSGLAEGLKKGKLAREDPLFDAFAAVEAAWRSKNEACERRALALRRRFVDEARAAARHRREAEHQLFFDDLLSELREALRPPAGDRLCSVLRDRYRFALIDEFQDTDPVQYEIFRRVWHRDASEEETGDVGGLVLIGDPKQAIYSFRGADVFTYLRAREDAKDAISGLGVNWRSDPGLIAALNALFERVGSPFGLEAIEFNRVRPRQGAAGQLVIPDRPSAGLRVLLADRESVAAFEGRELPEKPVALPTRFGRTTFMQAIAADMADLLDAGATIDGERLRASQIAVLCRTNAELARARRALEAQGIPCVDRGDADVFESREAWELLCVLLAMLRSGDPGRLRAALATGAMGFDAPQLAALPDESPELAVISERFAEYGRLWKESGFIRAFESWRREEGVTPRLLALFDGERRLTNWLHLAELLQGVATERMSSRAGLANRLERAIADPEERRRFGSEASLLRLERDDQAVSLVTLHRSKGLEYEIVYLPFLWEDASPRGPWSASTSSAEGRRPPVRFHDQDSGRRTLDLGGPDHLHHARCEREEAFSESMRLLYVGLTRAKHQCVIGWGAIGRGSFASTPIAWLLHASEGACDAKARESAATQLKKWSDPEWREAWESIGRDLGEEAVSVENLQWTPRGRWSAPSASDTGLDYAPPVRKAPAARVTASFSGLVRDAHRGGAAPQPVGPDAIGRDLDQEVGDANDDERDLTTDLAGGMDGFPRGAAAGSLLHDVLENVDFADWDEERVRLLAIHSLSRAGLDRHLQEQILHVVDVVSRTPLRREPEPFSLAQVASGKLRPEMEFTLAAPGGAPGGGLSPASLGKILEDAEPGSPLACYVPRLACLGWRELHGYLRGFIDAIFFDGERYYLVDYKSNHLGSRQSDYRPEALLAPMIDHDYVLQYLIYSVALDRHLACTLAGYDYEAHFGGVYYLFLRGMAPEHEPGCGIFYDRPEAEIVRRVSRLLGEGGRP